MARVRIPTPEQKRRAARTRLEVLFLIFSSLYIILFAVSTAKAEQRLVVANSNDHHFTTIVLGSNDGTVPVRVSFDSPQCPNMTSYDVQAGGAFAQKTAGIFCSQFLTIPVPPGVRTYSLISFADSSNVNSFALGPVGSITPTTPVRIGPLVSDADRSVYVTLLPSKPAPVTVELYDGDGKLTGREFFTAYLPVTQYRVAGKFAAGSIVVRVGWVGFGAGDPPPDPIFGFVTNASAVNSNSVAYPF